MDKIILVGVGGGPAAFEQGGATLVPFANRRVLDSPVVGVLIDRALEEGDWWRKECTRLLARGGRLVILCGTNPGQGLQTDFGQWLMRRSKMAIQQAGGPFTVRTLVPELRRLIENDLAYSFIGTSDVDVKLLAVAHEDSNTILAAITDVDRGQVVVLPVGINDNSVQHVETLVRAIPPIENYPEYLNAFLLPEEGEARSELDTLRIRQLSLEEKLQDARRLKRILYVGKLDLELEVVNFLDVELGIPARHTPGVAEDFWLVDSETDWAIGEVKSYEVSNVDKGAVGQLWTHRREAQQPESFPALLVANTFYKRQSAEGREEGIHPGVARRGKEDNILIVRTLDLFRMRWSTEVRKAFLEALRQEGGWFRVDSDLTWKVVSD
jgi:hypothetical protein